MSIHKNNTQRKDTEDYERARWIMPVSLFILLLSLCFSSFALGRISAQEDSEKGLVIETVPVDVAPLGTDTMDREGDTAETHTRTTASTSDDTLLVGSVNSNIYHFPWCSGAQRINDENKRTFSSYEEAHEAGYRAAKNCEGLE